ncbi:unnamed protein product [Rotaria socialis]|uniref:Uncharacterized protein n=2 Tax=Rotaria socialis TaxID=392032 RepID=A0A820X9S3_9BILA|nr:unnamed protein product [Rotaria socialis]
MTHNSTIKTSTKTNLINTTMNEIIQLNFSSSTRSTRYIFQFIILILFISILTFIGQKRNSLRILTRPYSQFSRLIVSIGIIGLILDDLLVINGITHGIWCSIHQIFLHFLLMLILAGRLLPDVYEYTNQHYHQYDSNKLKSFSILSFLILLCIQSFISLKWLWNNHYYLSNDEWNPPVLCQSYICPQLLIFILHLVDLIVTIQSIRHPFVLDDINPMSSIVFIDKKFCQLNSILIRSFYFTSTYILRVMFLPGQFSATFYSGILIIEYLLKYLIIIYHSNLKYESNIDNMNGMNNTGYLRIKTDDLNDDSRLLNNID